MFSSVFRIRLMVNIARVQNWAYFYRSVNLKP